ncbi:MAG: hypothetical protein AAFN18_21080 [Cyanobacteria bacterium J06554_6]
MTCATSPLVGLNLSDDSLSAPLYQSGQTAVYGPLTRATQQPVVVKILSQEYPNLSELVQFRNQYRFAKKLPIRSIARLLNLKFCGNSNALLVEKFERTDWGRYAQQHSRLKL